MSAKIVVLPGDGIGPEVTAEAVRVLAAAAVRAEFKLDFIGHDFGGCAIDRHGVPLTEATLTECRGADAVLLGAVGGPKWDEPNKAVRPEQGLLRLRSQLGLFANLRPVKPHPALLQDSPVKPERLAGVDLLVVRELTGGLYFGLPKGRGIEGGVLRAVDTLEYTEGEIARVVELAFRLAAGRRNKLTSVDKANVLESSRLWREVATARHGDHPGVALEHQLVDSCAMRLISAPSSFDVIVTENMFGDILTDEAAVLCGSLGLLPSASLGESGPGLYEPIHGSAPDLAGKGVANPVGAILSAALLLRHSLKHEKAAAAIESAVDRALAEGCRTADLGGSLTTRQMGDEVLRRLSSG